MKTTLPKLIDTNNSTMNISPGDLGTREDLSVSDHVTYKKEELIQFLQKPFHLRTDEDAQMHLDHLKDAMSYFKDLQISDEQIIKLLKRMNYEYLPEAKDVFAYGDRGGTFYMIIDGSVSVNIPKTVKAVDTSG